MGAVGLRHKLRVGGHAGHLLERDTVRCLGLFVSSRYVEAARQGEFISARKGSARGQAGGQGHRRAPAPRHHSSGNEW